MTRSSQQYVYHCLSSPHSSSLKRALCGRIAGRISPQASTHHVSSCDKRVSYVPCLQLPLTLWAGDLTIDILPDDVLLLIFYFDGRNVVSRISLPSNPSWPRLVHVCRRWRSVVFASPIVLDLRLVVTPGRRAELIDIWPPFPIIVRIARNLSKPKDYDSRIKAAIVHRNRVREIDIFLGDPQSERLVSAMREPYRALIHLRAYASASQHGWDRVLPDEFLGGSAPSLRHLYLCSILFPELPKLLTSATGLVDLTLLDCRWYIPPDTLFTCLAVLVNLKSFVIEFSTSILHPDPEHRFSQPLPPTRIVLPALTHFDFRWKSKYLDFLVARIDAPLLDFFCIAFDESGFSLDIDIPQLGPFMRRTTCFQALNEAHLDLRADGILVTSLPPPRTSDEGPGLRFSCKLQFMKPVLSSFFLSIYIVEHLYIYRLQYRSIFSWEDTVKDT